MTANPMLPSAVAIRHARNGLRKTQTEIAKAVGVKQPTIAFWETGRSIPPPRYREALAAALGVELAGLERACCDAETLGVTRG